MLRGKQWTRGVVLLTIGMLAAATLSIAPATAGKFLTKKKALKLFYPRAEANAQFLTPTEGDAQFLTPTEGDAQFLTPTEGDAQFLTPTEGDASYLPATGEVRMTASPMTWVKTNPTKTQVPEASYSIGSTIFGPSSAAVSDVPFAIAPTLPTVLSGRNLELVGVNACYGTDSTTLVQTRIWVTNPSSGSSAVLTDSTDQTDDNCLDYTLPDPVPIALEDDVALEFSVDYSDAGQLFYPGRATFILNIV
jgi:hypothetical protein